MAERVPERPCPYPGRDGEPAGRVTDPPAEVRRQRLRHLLGWALVGFVATTVAAAELRVGDGRVQVADSGDGVALQWPFPGGQERTVVLQATLAGCRTDGRPRDVVRTDGGLERVRRLVSADRPELACTLAERLVATPDSLRWEIEITTDAATPWSAPIETSLAWPDPAAARVWTAWGDSRPGPVDGADWSDPLVPAPCRDQALRYGCASFTRSDGFALPLVCLLEPEADLGLSLVQSPEDTLFDLDLAVTATGTVTLRRTCHRLAAGRPLRFTLDLVPHAGDWRPALDWLARRYPRFVDPPNPLASELAGCGAYSVYEGDLDAWTLHRMAFGFNWKASYDFPYMGQFLPPVDDTETWTNFRRQPTSIRQLAAYSSGLRRLGFHVLNYFNITEFGAGIQVPAPPRQATRDEELWRDANDFLHGRLAAAILPGPDGKPIGSWEGCVAMDPGEPVYQAFLLDQARRHVALLPDSAGICIDRMDWAACYNPGRDDGLSWRDGKPSRSLLLSWRDTLDKLGPVFHDAGKVIFGNPHVKRLELMEQLDGIYEEFTYSGFNLNLCGLLGLRKPVVGWTAASANLRPDPDAFFQRFLYLGVFPTAPFPGNDHTLGPDPWAERYYLDYGPLLRELRHRRWVLSPHVVAVEEDTARANVFDVPGGYAVPVVLAGKAERARVRLHGLPWPAAVQPRVTVLHPGRDQAQPLAPAGLAPDLVLDVPLQRGCALVRLSYVWLEPAFPAFFATARVEAGTAVPGADLRVRLSPGDRFAAPAAAAWQPLAGPLLLDATGTVQVAAFVGPALVGEPVVRTYVRVPLPAPIISPSGGVFADSAEATVSLPAEVAGTAELRATVDGSEPGPAAPPYTGPLRLTADTEVRARAFLAGATPGPVATAVFRRRPPVPPAPEVYIDSLTPARSTVGWGGQARTNRSIQDQPLRLGGSEYAHGLGVHATSELAYPMQPEYRRFVAVVGVDDEMRDYRDLSSAVFEVWADDRRLAASPVLRATDRWHLDVALPADAKLVRLLVTDAGDSINADHGDWCAAGFVTRP